MDYVNNVVVLVDTVLRNVYFTLGGKHNAFSEMVKSVSRKTHAAA